MSRLLFIGTVQTSAITVIDGELLSNEENSMLVTNEDGQQIILNE